MQLQPGTTIEELRAELDTLGLPAHVKPYHFMMHGKILGQEPWLGDKATIHASDGCTLHIKSVAEQRYRLGVRSSPRVV